eukprot:CAMPEP_0113477596 /NCGR_PEP_ID=MMETSP0014_2-20120614/20289_1 /TAXON_ID=2857 /ORGANISM="Nitzschia sp." /LENGTH=659 /DNA_ID=CAMNT_0000370695 /DNA_START=397 /DNA_END=2373 /DNA_ORIENTATION=+ /assembly_acc=CAM_ASM_000159
MLRQRQGQKQEQHQQRKVGDDEEEDDDDDDVGIVHVEGTLMHVEKYDDVMSAVAKDLYNLSFQERERAYDDIHGTIGPGEPAIGAAAQKNPTVDAAEADTAAASTSSSIVPTSAKATAAATTTAASPKNEISLLRNSSSSESTPSSRPASPSRDSDPNIVEEKLEEFDRFVDSIHPKDAYEMALSADPEYVRSRNFRLMFLRSQCFNVSEAAWCMVEFFAGKLDLFGPESLTRSLRYSDLKDDDIHYMNRAYQQILPSRDSAGRVVIVDTHLCRNVVYKTTRSVARAFTYMYTSLIENDEDVQKRGVVMIGYAVNSSLSEIDPGMHKVGNLVRAMIPIRYTSWHVCLGAETWFRRLQANMIRILPQKDRVRLRCHEGSRTEVMYSLLSYGIPVHEFPVAEDGTVQTCEHDKWLMMQRRKQEVYDLIRPMKTQISRSDHRLSTTQSNDSETFKQSLTNQGQQNQQIDEPAQVLSFDPFALQINHSTFHRSNVPARLENRDPSVLLSGLVEVPSIADVLVGRGQVYQNHPGNCQMRQIVREHLAEHQSTTSRKAKTDLAWRIVHHIQHQHGGRFLQRDGESGWWGVISDDQARSKVIIYGIQNDEIPDKRTESAQKEKQQPLSFKNDSQLDVSTMEDQSGDVEVAENSRINIVNGRQVYVS